MTDQQTATAIRAWAAKAQSHWSWPTDGCGYEQHVAFVDHRNANWLGGTESDFVQFCLKYAGWLERGRRVDEMPIAPLPDERRDA